MKVDELRPCPFCGSAARWAMTTEDDDWEIQCSNEGCLLVLYGQDKTARDTAAAWNTRAPDPDLLAYRELLKNIKAAISELPSVTGSSPVVEDSGVIFAIRDLQASYRDAALSRNFGPSFTKAVADLQEQLKAYRESGALEALQAINALFTSEPKMYLLPCERDYKMTNGDSDRVDDAFIALDAAIERLEALK
jgi:hypothetical protein